MDDDILPVRYKVLPLNDNHAIDIPNDYLDYTRVFVRSGQYIIPLVEDDSLGLVPNYDSNFNIQPYSQGVAIDKTNQAAIYNGYLSAYWFMVNWDMYGENIGRQFGGISSYTDTFKVNKTRNEIKINEDLFVNEVVLEYISNGMDADSATHIDQYAQMAIEMFAMWQFKENNRTYSAGEAAAARNDYVNERKVLRARLSDLTIDKLKRIVQHNSIRVKY